jgi:hypothetical protein
VWTISGSEGGAGDGVQRPEYQSVGRIHLSAYLTYLTRALVLRQAPAQEVNRGTTTRGGTISRPGTAMPSKWRSRDLEELLQRYRHDVGTKATDRAHQRVRALASSPGPIARGQRQVSGRPLKDCLKPNMLVPQSAKVASVAERSNPPLWKADWLHTRRPLRPPYRPWKRNDPDEPPLQLRNRPCDQLRLLCTCPSGPLITVLASEQFCVRISFS